MGRTTSQIRNTIDLQRDKYRRAIQYISDSRRKEKPKSLQKMVPPLTAQSPALTVVRAREWNSRRSIGGHRLSQRRVVGARVRVRVGDSCNNRIDDPILKDALKEPVAFLGGMFAGLLRLDLNEEPLKEWMTRAVEASGITEDDIDAQGSKADEEAPQQIVIE